MSAQQGTRNGILSLTIKDKAVLYAAYMPFLQHGGLFNGVPSFWTRAHTDACISFTKIFHNYFLAKEKARIIMQEEAFAAARKEKEILAEQKSIRESRNQISYYTLSTGMFL